MKASPIRTLFGVAAMLFGGLWIWMIFVQPAAKLVAEEKASRYYLITLMMMPVFLLPGISSAYSGFRLTQVRETSSSSSAALGSFRMTRWSRAGFVGLLSIGVVASHVLRELLNRIWGSGTLAYMLSWALVALLWMLPLCRKRVRQNIRFWSLRSTWTVLLLLPYPLLNVAVGQSAPALRHYATPSEALVWCAIYFALFVEVAWEELIFRGYALFRCGDHPRFAIVASAISFVPPHIVSGHPPSSLVPIFLFGLTAGIVRTTSGGLVWPILFHAAANVLQRVLAPHDAWTWVIAMLAVGAASATVALWRHPSPRKVMVRSADSANQSDAKLVTNVVA